MPRGKTGALKAPPEVLNRLAQFVPRKAAPAQVALIPTKLSMWGNDAHGDCVTAEEAFKCACDQPEDFVPDQTVIDWAQRYGFLEGATLPDVLDQMAKNGFKVDSKELRDGPYGTVDFTNESTLKNAIALGPVKVGMDSSALPSGAGNTQGWYATGGQPGQYGNFDHCCALCGYGNARDLYALLGVPLPVNLSATTLGYLFYTWSTIGFVDHAWIMSCVQEAYLRNPNTVFDPPPPPPPPPAPSLWQTLLDLLIQYGPQILAFLISILQSWHRDLLTQQARRGLKEVPSDSADTPTSHRP